MAQRNLLVVIEGNDGSGKGTQFDLLKRRAITSGYSLESFDFPQYGQPSAAPIEAMLRGDMQLPPFETARLYAADRLAAKEKLLRACATADIVVCNRYVSSNCAYQGARTDTTDAAKKLIAQIETLEYDENGLPRPDLTLFLSVAPQLAQLNVDQKAERSYTTAQRDIYEADLSLQDKVASLYRWLSQENSTFATIACMQDSQTMRRPEDIHEVIWQTILPLLKA